MKEIPKNLKDLLEELNIPKEEWLYVTGIERNRIPETYKKTLEELNKEGIEVIPSPNAFQRYKGIYNLLFNDDRFEGGAFVRFSRGTRYDKPLFTCCLVKEALSNTQRSVALFEEDSKGSVVFGSVVPKLFNGEKYRGGAGALLKKSSRGRIIVLHSFGRQTEASPVFKAILEEESQLDLIVVELLLGKRMDRRIEVDLVGVNSSLTLYVLSITEKGVELNEEIAVKAKAPRTSAVINVRNITMDGRSEIKAIIDAGEEEENVRGRIEIASLLFGKRASSSVWPVIITRSSKVDLDHSAFVGKVPEEVLNYLKSRGFDDPIIASLTIEGHFLPLLEHLPERYREEVKKLAKLIVSKKLAY